MLSNGLFNTLIGKSISRTASVQAYDPNGSGYLADGEVVVLDKTGAALTPGYTVSDSDFITIVQRSGATASTSNLKRTVRIQGANVTSWKGITYAAAAEQVSYVGYNSSTGSIDAQNSNTYQLRIVFKHDKELWSTQNNINYHEYTSDSSATQAEIAAGFAKQFAQIYPSSNSDIKVERVCDGTATALGSARTLTVTYGSTTVTASGSGHNLVAGDIVKIGGNATTDSTYLVASISGSTTIVLDSAFQGTSAAGVAAYEMSAVTSWGLKITGRALTFTTPTFNSYQKVAFDVTLGNFGTTVVTDSTAASKGQGVYEEVATAEYIALGYDGFLANRNAVPAQPLPASDAVSGTNYDTLSIQGLILEDTSVISGNKPSKYQVLIFLVDGAAQTTNLLAQLNPWMASTPKAFAPVSV